MKTKVARVVEKLVDENVSFTAYDVTKILRLSGEKIRHGKVRPLVHAAFENDELGVYRRTLITLPGIGSVNVFHLPYEDPNSYQSDWVDDDSKVSAFFPSATDDDDDDDDKNSHDVSSTMVKVRSICLDANSVLGRTFRTTKDGRLNIPTRVCEAVGFGHEVRIGKTSVSVAPSGKIVDGLAIQPPTPANYGQKRLVVDTDGRIRINARTLDDIFNDGNEYKITYDNDSVYVYQD